MKKSVLDGDYDAESRKLEWTPTILVVALLAVVSVLSAAGFSQVVRTAAEHAIGDPELSGYVGNQACARCHASIYDS
jgi:hypothetical protein